MQLMSVIYVACLYYLLFIVFACNTKIVIALLFCFFSLFPYAAVFGRTAKSLFTKVS